MKPSDLRKIIGEEVNQLVDRITEGKGQDLADKYVAKLRSEFRKLNDDELDEFRETIAKALDLKESVNEALGSWTSTLDDLISFGFGNLSVKFKGRDLGKVKDFKKLGSTVGPSITIRTFNYLLKKGGLKHDHKRNRAELGSKSSKYTKGSVELTEGEVNEVTLKKGDILKFKTGSKWKVVGPHGDGYRFRIDNQRGLSWQPSGWLDMMFRDKKVVVEGKVNEGLSVKDWHEETRPNKIIVKASNGKTLEITPKSNYKEKSYQAWLQGLDQYKTNPKAASQIDKALTQMANESVLMEYSDQELLKQLMKARAIAAGNKQPGLVSGLQKHISKLQKKMKKAKTNEASRGKIHKAVKKGSYPVTIVVISNGMAIKQELVKTPEAVPAAFNELQKQYPNANLSIEDNTGKRLFSESTKVNPEVGVDAKFSKVIAKIPNSKITRDIVLKTAKKFNVDPDDAIAYVEYGWDLDLDESVNEFFSGKVDQIAQKKFKKDWEQLSRSEKKWVSDEVKKKKESVDEAEFKHISKDEHKIKLAIKDVEKKSRLKANRDKAPEYEQEALNKIMLSKVLGREKLSSKYKAAWEKLKKEYSLKESKTMKKNHSLNEVSTISKKRAGAELKQKIKGKRSDGLGKYTATIYGMSGGKRVELKSLNDLNKYSEFEIDESVNEVATLGASKAMRIGRKLGWDVKKRASGRTDYVTFTKDGKKYGPVDANAMTQTLLMKKLTESVTEGKEEPIVDLLDQGKWANVGMGEKKLVKLSDAFDAIGDEQADRIASHLNMAIELMQEREKKSAVPHMNKFNKACQKELKLMKKQGLAESVKISKSKVIETISKMSSNPDEVLEGLWDNIRKKKARGESPAKPGDKDYPDDKAWDDAQESVNEGKKYTVSDFKVGDRVIIARGGNKPGVVKKVTKAPNNLVYVSWNPKRPSDESQAFRAHELIPESVNEGKLTEIRKGDYVGSAKEIGLVNKVSGSGANQVAYVKFDSRPKSFIPILARNLTKTGKKHKGKDLYQEGKINESVKPIKLSGNLKKDLDNVTHMATMMVKYAKDNFNTYIPTGHMLSQLTVAGYKEKDVLKYNIAHLAKAINTDLKKKYMKDFVAESVNEMQMINKKTGKDVTKHVIAYMEKKITKKEFEELTGLSKEKLKVSESGINEASSLFKKFDDLMNLRMKSMDVEQTIMDREKELKQLYMDMEQEAEPEGGPKASAYGKRIESLTKILNKDKAILSYILRKIDKLDQY